MIAKQLTGTGQILARYLQICINNSLVGPALDGLHPLQLTFGRP